MEDDKNTGKGKEKIGSSSNQEISAGQENAPAPAVANVGRTMLVGESSSGTGRARLSDWFPRWALPPGYGKGKRKIDSVYSTRSSDFNPSSRMRRRLLDGSPLDVERRTLTPLGRVLTLSQLPSLPHLMPLGGSPGAVPIQPPTTIGMIDPPFVSPAFQRMYQPVHDEPEFSMTTIFEDSDQDVDTSTPRTPSSNDEMIDADSDTARW